MSNAHPNDIERLASRLAMIVSDDGEAGNAGVAAAHLARRMGLTGGQLKAIVLAGAAQERFASSTHAEAHAGAEHQARADRLEAEAEGLRHSLRQLDIAVRRAQDEADLLRDTGRDLADRLDRARAAVQAQKVVGLGVLGAILVGVLIAIVAPRVHIGPQAGQGATFAGPPSAVSAQVATVRVPGAEVHREPDRASMTVVRLPVGTRVLVHRLVWRTLNQWAEIDVDGNAGFVSTNDVDMP